MSYGNLVVPANTKVDDLGKPSFDVQGGHKYTLMVIPPSTPLFPSTPAVKDVQQGGIGDCFVLAAVIAVLQQPKGGQFIEGMMRDDKNGNVVVRLYDAGNSEHFVSVAKKIVINSTTITSKGVDQPFAKGPPWVSILEQAVLALDASGNWAPGNPKFSTFDGATTYRALRAILGADVEEHTIPDLADPTERSKAFEANINNDFGSCQSLFFNWAMNEEKIKNTVVQGNVTMEIFGGKKDGFTKFMTWALSADKLYTIVVPGTNGKVEKKWPTKLWAFNKEIVNKPKNMIRYEDIETFFKTKGLEKAVADTILAWLEKNKVVPGKKFTKLYGHWEEWLYTMLFNARNASKPALLTTRTQIGTPEGFGHSANEPKVKGLVANHEYAVVDVEDDKGRKFVTVRNPWRSYGRTYVPDLDDGRARAAAYDGATSRLPLQEITKRFRRIQVSAKSLA